MIVALRVNLFGILLQVFKGRPEYRARPLYNLFFLANQNGIPSALAKVINSAGMSCQIGGELDQIDGKDSTPLDAVLLDLSSMEQIDARHIVEKCRDRKLTARVKLAMYRVNGPAGPKLLRVGDLSIDLERYEVNISGRRVALTYKEFQLLVLLASNPGRVYTREALLSQIWGYDYLGGTRTVDVHIRRLRSKVESPGHAFVETIWNVGYRFKEPS